jgi:Ca2+/Na+ antiporter
MFSQGQIIFGGCFFVAFIIAMIISYRKDIKIHKAFYKGNYKILLGFFFFIAILFVIKVFFKR